MNNNNVNLIYVPMKKLKTTTVCVYIHRDLNSDDVSKNAVIPYVLKQGCRVAPDFETMAKYLENLYGATLNSGIFKMGNNQIMYFRAETISDKYAIEKEPLTEELLKLLLSVVFEPVTENDGFKKSIVDVEKNNAKDRILSQINDKRLYASQRCQEEMCKGEVYALSAKGTVEGVEKINEKELYEYYKEAISSSVIDIYVCGDADKDKLESLTEEFVSGIDFKDAKITETQIHNPSEDVKKVTDVMEVNQGKLSLGFSTGVSAGDKDYYKLLVMNSVFGAGVHSKLFNNVREKLSLAYYASSSVVGSKGIILVNAGIEFDNFNKAYDEIMVQLEAVKNGEITDFEYTSSINSLVNALESYNDEPVRMIEFMAGEKISNTFRTLDYAKEQIRKVTVEDVKEVAQKVKLDTVYFLTGEEKK